MSDWTVNLEFDDGTSSKFWRARVDGKTLYVNYGRIGTNGQTQVKELASAEAAKKEYDKLEREKRKKGYADAGSGGGGGGGEDADEGDDEGDDDEEEAAPAKKKKAAAPAAPAPAAATVGGKVVEARLALDAKGRKIATHLSLQGATVRLDSVETYASPEEARKAYYRLLATLAGEGHEEQ